VAKIASLWPTKHQQRVKESKVFWIMMEMNIHMTINHKLQLSPTIYDQLVEYVEFKADLHQVSVRVWKDPKKKWYDLPYLATKDTITAVVDC